MTKSETEVDVESSAENRAHVRASLPYRREINGLRGLAVVPVILFHAGFIGVDVFFVISGYLITSLILRDQETGHFSLLHFYERRARRILPVLFVVTVACIPAAWMWMIPSELNGFARSITAVSMFVSNFFFHNAATGYFATASESKPLLHTWSLAVEEQFYILFPLYVLAMWVIARRWLAAAFAITAAASLVLAQWGGNLMTQPPFLETTWSWVNVPAWAFYWTPTRVWELLIGALAGVYLRGALPSQTRVNQAGGVLGVGLILLAIVMFDDGTPWPSIYTLIPVGGTVMIIASTAPESLAGRWLSWRPLVAAGAVSYSAYLWHHPIFAFARLRSLDEPPFWLLVALVFMTFAIAYVSWRYVELPFRDRTRFTSRQVLAATILASAALFAVGSLGQRTERFESRWRLPNSVHASFGRTTRAPDCFDIPYGHTAERWYCDVTSNAASHSFVVFGDSHSVSLLPAFEKAAADVGVNGLYVGVSGCLPLLDVFELRSDDTLTNCRAMTRRVLDYVKTRGIKKVFLVARWVYYTEGGYDGTNLSYIGVSPDSPATKDASREAFRHGLEETLAAYSRIGVTVYLVQQVPEQVVSPERLYYMAYADGDPNEVLAHSVPILRHLQLQKYPRTLFADASSRWHSVAIDLDQYFCSGRECQVGSATRSFYSDSNHLSIAGAALVVPELKKYL